MSQDTPARAAPKIHLKLNAPELSRRPYRLTRAIRVNLWTFSCCSGLGEPDGARTGKREHPQFPRASLSQPANRRRRSPELLQHNVSHTRARLANQSWDPHRCPAPRSLQWTLPMIASTGPAHRVPRANAGIGFGAGFAPCSYCWSHATRFLQFHFLLGDWGSLFSAALDMFSATAPGFPIRPCRLYFLRGVMAYLACCVKERPHVLFDRRPAGPWRCLPGGLCRRRGPAVITLRLRRAAGIVVGSAALAQGFLCLSPALFRAGR